MPNMQIQASTAVVTPRGPFRPAMSLHHRAMSLTPPPQLCRGLPASGRQSAIGGRHRAPAPLRVSAEVEVSEPASPTTKEHSKWNRAACFKATKYRGQMFKQQGRPLSEYMALPASQYSVLDAEQIERIDDDTFKCYVGKIKIFKFIVEPAVTVNVQVDPEGKGCTISLLECEVAGSKAAEDINNKFDAYMMNKVRLSDGDVGAEEREVTSDILLQVGVEVPRWFPMPADAVSKVGSGIMQGVINTMVPRFLRQLEADYTNWAAGDDSREAVSTGEAVLDEVLEVEVVTAESSNTEA